MNDEPDMDAAEEPPRLGAGPSPTPEPTRRVLNREELARRRARQIQLHVERAEQAFGAGDYDTGIYACEEVLLLDPENARALALLDCARTALDQHQAADWLDQAEKEIQRGALSTAMALVDRASTLAPSLSRVAEVRRNAEGAIRERERTRDSAEHERRARNIVREATRAFDAGNHEQALQMLARYEPAHDLVTEAAEQLRAEAERIAEQERLEAEHRARQQRITAVVDIAREEISHEQFAEAIERLRALEEAEGQSSEIAGAIAAAEAGQAEADRMAALQQELPEHVARAAGLLARNDAAAAMSRVEAALAIDPQYAPAVALKAKVQDALQRIAQRHEIEQRLARERAQAIASAIDTAQRATSHEEAIAALTEALELDPDHVVARQLLEQRRDAPAQEQGDIQWRQENDHARGEPLRLLVESARRALNQGDLDTARDLTRQALDVSSESVEARLLLEDIAPLEEFAPEDPTAAATEHQTVRRHDSRALEPVMSEWSANASVTPQPRMSVAARPESGTSRPAPATTVTNPLRARSLRRWMPVAVLGAIAVVGLASYAASRQPSSRVEGTVTVPATPATPNAGVPTPTPLVAAETPAVSANREAELDRQVGELHTRAREAFARGDWQLGLTAVAEAARLRPNDAEPKGILADAVQDARTRAAAAREAARVAGASDRSPTFRAANQKQGEGDSLLRGGKTGDGIRALWETAGLFQLARAEADKSRGRSVADVPRPGDAAVARTGSVSVPPLPPVPQPATSPAPPAAENAANPAPPPTPTRTVATLPAAPAPARPAAAEEASPAVTGARSGGAGNPPSAGDRLPAPPIANAPLSAAAVAAQERPAIQATLEAYASGYSRLDAAAIKRVYPGIDENGLKRGFGAYRSQQVQVQVEQIQMTGPATADVSTRQMTAASMQVGVTQRDTRQIVFRLEKRNGSWIIIERR